MIIIFKRLVIDYLQVALYFKIKEFNFITLYYIFIIYLFLYTAYPPLSPFSFIRLKYCKFE